MDDKKIMENIIYASKVINDLFMHASIEASNDKVMTTFNKASQDSLKLHNEIFKAMEVEGLYTVENAEQNKIKQLKEKLECKCDCK